MGSIILFASGDELSSTRTLFQLQALKIYRGENEAVLSNAVGYSMSMSTSNNEIAVHCYYFQGK